MDKKSHTQVKSGGMQIFTHALTATGLSFNQLSRRWNLGTDE